MMISKKWMWFLAGILAISASGCHDLQPYRLNRWNRVPDSMPRTDYNFSIPDPPIPAGELAPEQTPRDCSSNLCAE